MFSTMPILVWILLGFIFIMSTTLVCRKQTQNQQKKQPPSPPALPIVGHLHMMGALPHRVLQKLSKTYGPIMSLRLGRVPVVVVSSPETAELFLKTNEITFASRPKTEASVYFSYGHKGMVFSKYGPYWRNMRKLCTLQFLSATKIEYFSPLRKMEVEKAVKSIEKAAKSGEVVNLSEVVHGLMEDIVFKMVLGCSKVEEFDLKGIIHEGMMLAGKFNVSDFVPWLRVFDLQGLRRNFKRVSKEIDKLLEKIIKDHEDAAASNVQNYQHKDFIDILLSLMHQPIDPHDEQNHIIDRTNIKAIALDMIAAAFDTSASVILWVLSELLRHPSVMKKLQNEISNIIGMNKLVEENNIDLSKLSYLDMVIKETFRLHPVAPLIVRESINDIVIQEYYIKKSSRILLNYWAIGRDPKVWSDNADKFYPERFLDNNIDVRGYDFELLPFGTGRRGCAGMNLGLVSVKFILCQFVHCFDWKLPKGMDTDDVDMTEEFGLLMPRAKDLFAMPTYRLHEMV